MSRDQIERNAFRQAVERALLQETGLIGLALTDRQMEQFVLYADYLVEMNQVMNLTGIVEPEKIARLHFLDSLMLLSELPAQGLLVDVGTGAGFPGLPLKIVRPDLDLVLLDSLAKRVGFLQQTVDLLGLEGMTCINARAEDAGRDPKLRGKAAVVTARAVASLPVLAEYCQPLLAVGGRFLAMKGRLSETEAKAGQRAARILGGTVTACKNYALPGSDIARSLVVIRQDKRTPKAYPRTAGLPAKSPL